MVTGHLPTRAPTTRAPILLALFLAAVGLDCGDDPYEPVSAGANRDAPVNLGGSDAGVDDAGVVDVRPDPARDEPPDRILREGVVGTISLVVDGDTLHVTVDGWYHRVRLQGVNAPECEKEERETSDGRRYVCVADQEWWGLNSYDALRDRVLGHEVTVRCEQDVGEACPVDSFDRFLAFIETDEGDVGEWMARNGHAMSFTKFPSSRRARYCAAEDQAISEHLGMWSLGDRDAVLARMNESTRDWYDSRDRLCAEALGE